MYGPMDRSADALWIVLGALFAGAVALSSTVNYFAKGCHIRGLPTGSVCQAYMDWHGKCMCRVGRVFPCRVYIDLNRRDSQI
jgi:hypothetical protein